jgi:hypothetical protein
MTPQETKPLVTRISQWGRPTSCARTPPVETTMIGWGYRASPNVCYFLLDKFYDLSTLKIIRKLKKIVPLQEFAILDLAKWKKKIPQDDFFPLGRVLPLLPFARTPPPHRSFIDRFPGVRPSVDPRRTMTTHSVGLALADADYPSWTWRLTVGKRGNHVPERWMAWLCVEERRMAAVQPFLHTDEGEAWPFLCARGERKRRARNRDGNLICQVAIFER